MSHNFEVPPVSTALWDKKSWDLWIAKTCTCWDHRLARAEVREVPFTHHFVPAPLRADICGQCGLSPRDDTHRESDSAG